MRTITINTTDSKAVYYWASKEEGSYEDHNKDPEHAYALLQKFGRKLTLTEEQAKTLIKSGHYTVTGYNDDEIEGGARTKKVIANYVKKIKEVLQIEIERENLSNYINQ